MTDLELRRSDANHQLVDNYAAWFAGKLVCEGDNADGDEDEDDFGDEDEGEFDDEEDEDNEDDDNADESEEDEDEDEVSHFAENATWPTWPW